MYGTHRSAVLEGTGRTNRPKSELTTTTNGYVLVLHKWQRALVLLFPVKEEKNAEKGRSY
eukprot:15178314-Ditylum_brightwellii.AAC.1